MREIWSDKTDDTIKSLFGVILSAGLLIHKIYFADNSADTAYEYWSFVIFFVAFLIMSLLFIITDVKKATKKIIKLRICSYVLLILMFVRSISDCIILNRCFLRRTVHYATPDDADYWVSISINLIFATILLWIAISDIRELFKKRKAAKAIEITKQQRISKRMRERAKKRMEREKAKEYR
jgi:phosphoglycerol transferase MdoB-like AlkP superfamily enzyme